MHFFPLDSELLNLKSAFLDLKSGGFKHYSRLPQDGKDHSSPLKGAAQSQVL